MLSSVIVPFMAIGLPILSRSSSVHLSLEPTKKKTMSSFKFITNFHNPSGGSVTKRSFRVTASDQRSGEADSGPGVQEDLNYLLKLVVGSVAGGAVIKYGSVLFPQITRPNLAQALFIIVAPVVISMILLFLSSYSSKKQNLN